MCHVSTHFPTLAEHALTFFLDVSGQAVIRIRELEFFEFAFDLANCYFSCISCQLVQELVSLSSLSMTLMDF